VTKPGFTKLHSIKQLFTIQELFEYEWKDGNNCVKLIISEVIYNLIQGLIGRLVGARSENKKLSKPIESVMFTIPTGTNEKIQLVYRNCIKKAIEETIASEIPLENIFVVEEFAFLKYCSEADYSPKGITLFVDIGHSTTDITVVNKHNVITYASGDVGGVFLAVQVDDKTRHESRTGNGIHISGSGIHCQRCF